MRYPRNMQGYGGHPPARRLARRRPDRRQPRPQLRGGRRELASCTATPPPRASSPRSPAPSPGPASATGTWRSVYEYGARAGFWRLRDLFVSRDVPVTIYGVASALARSPAQVAAMQEAGWEIASHGLRWIDYRNHTPEAERADLEEAIRLHTEVTGEPPRGWYTGRTSAQTVDLVSETGRFDWVADTYDDDLPYWREHAGRQQLIIPYSLETNDMRFSAGTFHTSEDFFTYLRDTFDTLYAEGEAGSPEDDVRRPPLPPVGRPGRIKGLADFLAHIQAKPDVWIATRGDIAAHWRARHPAPPIADRPTTLTEGRLRPPLRRRLRALPLDRRARLRPRARPRPRHRHRPRQRALPRLPLRQPGGAPRRPQGPPRPRRQAGGGETPHRPNPPPSRPAPASTPSPTPSAPASPS